MVQRTRCRGRQARGATVAIERQYHAELCIQSLSLHPLQSHGVSADRHDCVHLRSVALNDAHLLHSISDTAVSTSPGYVTSHDSVDFTQQTMHENTQTTASTSSTLTVIPHLLYEMKMNCTQVGSDAVTRNGGQR
jgi:hypothetical protein